MARRMKGGFGEDGSSMMVPLLLSLLGIAAIVVFLVMVGKKETFVPTAPSSSGDNKEVTPSGNVILY